MLNKVKWKLKNVYSKFFPPQKPSDYSKYLKLQVSKYLSHELENEHWSAGQARYINREFSDIDRSSKILDISCGDGVGLKVFRELGFTDVTGFEYAEEKANLARRFGYPVYDGDFHDLSIFGSNSFDLIYSSHSLEHALFPVKVMGEFYRILKGGGTLKLVLPFPDVGPLDAHVAKVELGTDLDDGGEKVLCFVRNQGFEIINYVFDDYREVEIWITGTK